MQKELTTVAGLTIQELVVIGYPLDSVQILIGGFIKDRNLKGVPVKMYLYSTDKIERLCGNLQTPDLTKIADCFFSRFEESTDENKWYQRSRLSEIWDVGLHNEESFAEIPSDSGETVIHKNLFAGVQTAHPEVRSTYPAGSL